MISYVSKKKVFLLEWPIDCSSSASAFQCALFFNNTLQSKRYFKIGSNQIVHFCEEIELAEIKNSSMRRCACQFAQRAKRCRYLLSSLSSLDRLQEAYSIIES